ncbi:hypothetical protein JG688_00003630 [Phytophthora aleatoria]|uniref:Uncharacterized protein n=1 Tax=Phytophthora aleatoria TaxID=2496075 RepID=A0A8J5M9Y7_9STRA|nr:hypothetical protein JG688_00003630 [Phytophthora aleatoria]
MVRVWLRPCASAIAALGRAAPSAKTTVLRAQTPRSLAAHNGVSPLIGSVRSLATKGKDDGKKEFKKKSTFEKVEEAEDPTELPDEVKYLSQELDEKDLQFTEELDFDDDDEDEGDAELSPAEWAKKFEREVAEWDQEEGDYDEDGVINPSPVGVEDDRLYVEMPGYDASLSLAESQIGVKGDQSVPDPFKKWEQGMA